MNIPEGYKLVPVEPTKEMREAIYGLLSAYDDGSDITPSFFMKMLINAAPTPPQPVFDESKERELFMSEYPLPSGCQWSEEHQNFGWVKKSAFQRVITYRALWTGWKACAQSRAKSMEVGDEAKPSCHWACTGCSICGSAGHSDSWF